MCSAKRRGGWNVHRVQIEHDNQASELIFLKKQRCSQWRLCRWWSAARRAASADETLAGHLVGTLRSPIGEAKCPGEVSRLLVVLLMAGTAQPQVCGAVDLHNRDQLLILGPIDGSIELLAAEFTLLLRRTVSRRGGGNEI